MGLHDSVKYDVWRKFGLFLNDSNHRIGCTSSKEMNALFFRPQTLCCSNPEIYTCNNLNFLSFNFQMPSYHRQRAVGWLWAVEHPVSVQYHNRNALFNFLDYLLKNASKFERIGVNRHSNDLWKFNRHWSKFVDEVAEEFLDELQQ